MEKFTAQRMLVLDMKIYYWLKNKKSVDEKNVSHVLANKKNLIAVERKCQAASFY